MKASRAVSSLSALAQDTRLAVFRMLVQHGATGMAAGEIAERLHIAPAALSFHLKELAHAALVTSRQHGRYVYYSANYAEMNRLLEFLTENCCAVDGAACPPAAACIPAGGALAKRKVKT